MLKRLHDDRKSLEQNGRVRTTSKRSGVQSAEGTKSPNTRVIVTIVGVAVVIIGLFLVFSGMSAFMSNPFSVFGSSGGMNWFILSAIGGFSMVFGVLLIYLANMRWVYSYVAKGVVEGMRRGGGIPLSVDTGQAVVRGESRQTVKIKCRNCGALNDEDDEYCGKCGQRL
jgi:hypothetical protein